VSWQLLFSKAAGKDAVKIQRAGLRSKTDALLDLIEKDPFTNPPPFEKLVGDLQGFYSRRINIQHRLVYRVDKNAQRVFVERMWTHYE
jgi:Txe/YoeB family toxin of toxin-antitoxin system